MENFQKVFRILENSRMDCRMQEMQENDLTILQIYETTSLKRMRGGSRKVLT